MSEWNYASYDVDHSEGDDYTCRTDFMKNGTVHSFEAINGSWSNGHTHTVYATLADYYSGTHKWRREIKDSYGRPWENRY